MSEDIGTITPRIMDFTIPLPDRDTQYYKTGALLKRLRKRIIKVSNVVKGDDGLDAVTNEPDVVDAYETEELFTTGSGENTKVYSLKDFRDAVVDFYQNKTLLQIQTFEKRITGVDTPATTKLQSMKNILSFLFPTVDFSGTAQECLDNLTNEVKNRGKWGLGCPGNCGYFWEFEYANMVPQTFSCPRCGVKITLE